MIESTQAGFFAPVLLRASAGTGKTFQLSNRYIGLTARGELPERILATTFTRKAAGEIQQRIMQRLANAARDPAAAADLGHHIGLPGFRQGDALEALKRFIASQHRVAICTLDSLCVQIAQCFGLEIGLPPSWRILDEVDQRRCRQDAVRRICAHPESREFVELMRLLHRGDAGRPIQSKIEREVRELYSLYQDSSPEAWTWVRAEGEKSPEELARALEQLGTVPLPRTKTGKKEVPKHWQSAMRDIHRTVQAGAWEEFLCLNFVQKILQDEPTFDRHPIEKELREAMAPLIEHARFEVLSEVARRNEAIARLLGLYSEEFERAKAAHGGLSFDDVKRRLASGAVLGNLDDVYYRLDTKFGHLLLDEFQDTSRAEWQVVHPIAAELLSKPGPESTFFCVGDVKQAIYGWRGGVAQIFGSLEREWPQLEAIPQMTQSRRSSAAVIDTVNTVFQSISSNAALFGAREGAERWQQGFELHSTARTDLSGFVSLRVYQSKEPEAKFEEVVECVADLLAENPSIEIGILVRANRGIGKLLFDLTRRGIPASGEGGNPLTDSPAVVLVLSLFRLADHPADLVSAFHLANSPLGDRFSFQDWRSSKLRSEVAYWLRSSVLRSGYGQTVLECVQILSPHCGQSDLERLEQLAQLAFHFDQRPGHRLRDFIQLVEMTPLERATRANVRVMTIHKSKGLEFDAVLLPELDGALTRDHGLAVLQRRPDPLSAPERISVYVSKSLRCLHGEFETMYEQGLASRIEEELSVLYVALTRARRALYMFMAPVSERSSIVPRSHAGVLWNALAPELKPEPGEVLYEYGKADWLLDSPQQLPIEQDDRVVAVPDRLLFPERSRRRRSLPRKSPSRMAQGPEMDMATVLAAPHRESADQGIRLHMLCEELEWLNGEIDRQELAAALKRRTGCSEQEAQGVVAEFAQLLLHAEIRAVFERPAGAGGQIRLEREFPFALRMDDALVTGIMDRLVLRFENGECAGAEIIDFKSDRVDSSEEALRVSTSKYEAQLSLYRQAIATLFSIPVEKVACRLAFLRAGRVVSVSR